MHEASSAMPAEPPWVFPALFDTCCSASGPCTVSSLWKEKQDPALLRQKEEMNQCLDRCSRSATATRLPCLSWRSLVRSQRCKGLLTSPCHSWAIAPFGAAGASTHELLIGRLAWWIIWEQAGWGSGQCSFSQKHCSRLHARIQYLAVTPDLVLNDFRHPSWLLGSRTWLSCSVLLMQLLSLW